MATIKAIDNRSIHQIQSGQVIVDLISVVKELVENSLDAGATSIEIRFKNQGLDSIEVQDNGKGISPDDFETVALKHYTSKLSSYEDLTSLDTFGFRGEALSSLCALSKFQIVTAREQDGAVGRKLDFETSGKLKGSSVIAAQRGTTVSVEDLFNNLPVRRIELQKNIKREYNKVIAHLHAYACISVGVRFAVTNQMPKGRKISVFSTKANTTTKENITNVFGAKTLVALAKLDLHLEMEPSNGPFTQSARNWSTQPLDRSRQVHVQGYISKPVFGEGRQAPDRQMFFVNSRPCGLPQVSKAVNEVYKSFNVSQVPFVFANLIMDTNAYDVNVSPDKRSIMLHDQTALLDSLKKCLTELFENTDQTIPQSQLPDRKLPSYKPLTVQRAQSAAGSIANASDESDEDDTESSQRTVSVKPKVVGGNSTSLLESWVGKDSDERRNATIERAFAVIQPAKSRTLDGPAHERDIDGAATTAHTEPEGLKSAEGGIVTSASGSVVAPTDTHARSQHEPDPVGSPYDDLFSQRPPDSAAAADQPDRDIHGHSHIYSIVEKTPIECANNIEKVSSIPNGGADNISVVGPVSQKATPGPVQNAFDRMRPKRTPLQTAEITIGDETTTTVIGSSPPYKRQRVHQPANSQTIAAFGGSPLLARGLRTFAAPGSQLELDSSIQGASLRCKTNVTEQSSDSEDEGEDEDEKPINQITNASYKRNAPFEKTTGTVPSNDTATSDPLDALQPAPDDDDDYDESYIDEDEKKLQEDERVARLIQEAEVAAAQPSDENIRRASQVLKNGGTRKEATLQLVQYVETSCEEIRKRVSHCKLRPSQSCHDPTLENGLVKGEIDDTNAETRLSLIVNKSDFDRMRVVGQFNLGFILAVRPGTAGDEGDQLFIVDQHAADEKYNYERLQRTVTLQNQRLVRPKPLDLTAIEEEVIVNNIDALKANGFEIEVTSDMVEEEGAGRQCRLITLPISGEKTFDLSDLEELLHLLSEHPSGSSEVPRPKKVQKMLAMRACRSSIMVGKTLTHKQMGKVVKHMGEMEKPWNCPHGRPTMRHLAGLGTWSGWSEGSDMHTEPDDEASQARVADGGTDWTGWLASRS